MADPKKSAKAKSAKQKAARRIIANATDVSLPDPIGRRTLKYRNPDLGWLEEELDDLLERLNRRVEAGRVREIPTRLEAAQYAQTGETPPLVECPFDSLWAALEHITTSWPMSAIGPMLFAGLRHDGVTRAQVDDLPPWAYNDPAIAAGIMRALAVALGVDPDAFAALADQEDGPTEDPTLGDDDEAVA